MEFKSMEKWRVQQKFNLTDEQFDNVVKKMKRRHPLESWVHKRIASNGERVVYIKLECVEWLSDVYFNKKYYLDADIKFFQKQVKRLEEELNIPHKELEYKDISLYDLRDYFGRTKNTIGVAINRMEKRNPTSYKYNKDGKVMISKEGVKWLTENYFRKAYLKELELYKLSLQKEKKKLYEQSRRKIQ